MTKQKHEQIMVVYYDWQKTKWEKKNSDTSLQNFIFDNNKEIQKTGGEDQTADNMPFLQTIKKAKNIFTLDYKIINSKTGEIQVNGVNNLNMNKKDTPPKFDPPLKMFVDKDGSLANNEQVVKIRNHIIACRELIRKEPNLSDDAKKELTELCVNLKFNEVDHATNYNLLEKKVALAFNTFAKNYCSTGIKGVINDLCDRFLGHKIFTTAKTKTDYKNHIQAMKNAIDPSIDDTNKPKLN